MTVEELNLRASWDCWPSDYLDCYLVSGTHEIVPIRRYYRNRVSMEKVRASSSSIRVRR